LPEFGSRCPITLDRYPATDLPLKKTWRSWSANNLDRLRQWTRGSVQSPIEAYSIRNQQSHQLLLPWKKECLLEMAANMSSNSTRAPFTVLLTLSLPTSSSPSRCRRQPCPQKSRCAQETCFPSHDETTLSSETCPSSLHHTAALYQRHGAVSSGRDCRVSA
jgi:hypothetical protein